MTKEKTKARVAFVGAGGMANSVHYPSIASFDDAEIVGICDVNATALHETADKYDVPREARFGEGGVIEYQEMIEKVAPDGVYVVGQPHLMIDIWLWCLREGLNLYIEKPMGLSIHQARSMAYLAEKRGCITQVSHQRRSAPILVKMRNECLKKGPITHAICEFYKCDLQSYLTPRDHMMDDCTHSIDTVRWMCGGEVEKIESHCKRVGTEDINWIGATIYFDNGSTGYVLNSWVSGRRIFRVEMHAPGVYTDAEVEGKAYLYADGDYEGAEYDTKEVAESDDVRVFGGFETKNREFVDSILTGREVTSSPFRDCLKTMEVAETILANALLAGE